MEAFMTTKNQSQITLFKGISRRSFIRDAGLFTMGAGVTLGLLNTIGCSNANLESEAYSKYETRNMSETMSYSPLGKTNLLVSRFAMGGVQWNPDAVHFALNQGVNLIHGSTRYNTMEAQAETLKGHWDKFWFVLKHSGSPEDMVKTVDECLATLKRDHVEAVLFVIRDIGITDYEKVKLHFDKIHKAGKVKWLGVTVHTRIVPEVCAEVIRADIFDIILTMYQPDRRDAVDRELALAAKKNMGILSMKNVQGVSDDAVGQAYTDALSRGYVSSALRGIETVEELKLYLNAAHRADSSTAGLQNGIARDLSVCGACGKCLVCPRGVEVQEIMRCATYYSRQKISDNYIVQTYRNIPRAATVAVCIDCGQCEQICPRALPIRKTLRLAHHQWSSRFYA